MIVDSLRVVERHDQIERSARVRWRDVESRLRVTGPADHVIAADDASPWLPATLLAAMHLHEDLTLDGPVSPRLLRRSALAQSAYRAWNPELRVPRVEAAAEAAPPAAGHGVASFYSRGVDSTYSATAARVEPAPLDRLVYCSTLELIHDERVRAEELRLAREAAARIGLPLVAVETNVRELFYPWLSWGDAHGGALAFIALSLAGGLRHAVVPSSDSYASLSPHGSSPLLDPLFSTETLELEHDSIELGRLGKVRRLTEERPELLPYLKVCFMENRPDNCGRCGKCLWTMACLSAVDALPQATGFPAEIDVRAIARIRRAPLSDRIAWLEVLTELDARGDRPALARAIRIALRRSARPSVADRVRARRDNPRGRKARRDASWSVARAAFRRHWTNTALALLRDGEPPDWRASPPGRGPRKLG